MSLSTWFRRWFAPGAGGPVVVLDYPVRPEPRWGETKPPHPGLQALLASRRTVFAARLAGFLRYRDRLLSIPARGAAGDSSPAWINDFLPGLDAVALYGFLAEANAARYIEIGSGHSTRFARRAVRDHGLRTRIISVDPSPRVGIDALCDEVVRRPFETLEPAWFDILGEGDILFLDGSHRALMNSDATAFFIDVLPRLRPGVVVHVHDVFLPYDYPSAWKDRWYSEQYLLACWLLAGGTALEVLLPCFFATHDLELRIVLDDLWREPVFAGVPRHGVSFWMRRI